MPTTNLRKHVIPLSTEASFTRATVFKAFGESIHDVVPVANTTARAQLVTDLNAAGVGPSSTNPLVVYRADAPGLHKIESTTNGTVWVPASGRLTFASKPAADSFATSYPGLLSVGDQCVAGGTEYTWNGTSLVDVYRAAFGPDGNGTVENSILEKSLSGWVDLHATTQRTGSTTYATNLILGVLPLGFRPPVDTLAPVLTYGSGSPNTALVRASDGVVVLVAASPAGHTIARVQARFKAV